DDWTTGRPSASSQLEPGQASPCDNVVFEAGLFGGVLGMRRTFILHASGAKLPTDLLGLTCVRYADTLTPSEMRTATRKFATQSRTNFALLVSTAHGGSSR
ncbi:MAG: TIR domain-containing protein, partial [Pseudolabrys sp.]